MLILGGAQQHCKLVESAREMGIITYVVDYLDDSPAKLMADRAFKLDVRDIESLASLCVREGIDGAASGWLDPCQIPYLRLCERMSFPCYGDSRAFDVMTDKARFKEWCRAHEVGTIPYECGTPDELNAALDSVELPAFVKPVDSRGSRGQSVCFSRCDLQKEIERASKESKDGRVIVEKYMAGAHDISVTYFFVDGEPCLERLSDRILGRESDGLGNVAIGSVSPSVYADRYISEVHNKVVAMLRDLGCANGPVFMQGFVDDDGFYFYDPGLRFPGGEYERAVKTALGIDYPGLLVEYALTGAIACTVTPEMRRSYLLDGRMEVIHDVTVRPGVIRSVEGIADVSTLDGVVSVSCRYRVGESVPPDCDVSRRFAEVNYLANDVCGVLETSVRIQDLLRVSDERGDMKVSSMADGLKLWAERRGGEL